MSAPLRLGSIQYLNSYPVDYALAAGKVPVAADIHKGTPAQLNWLMDQGKLDVSPVSSLFYAQHAEKLCLLPDLSISSESGVESVLLCSYLPLAELGGKSISISEQGRTTPMLLRAILELRYGVLPHYTISGHVREDLALRHAAAALVIGDDALRLDQKPPYVIDLAQEWRAWTQHDFVFALWAVRREVYKKEPEAVQAVWQALKASEAWGRSHRAELTRAASEETQIAMPIVERYLTNLQYRFGPAQEAGFNHYLSCLERLGERGLSSLTNREAFIREAAVC